MGKRAKTLAPSHKESRGKRSNCRCTRCGVYSKQYRADLRSAAGVRCICCGGNVVIAGHVVSSDLDREYRKIVATPVGELFVKPSAPAADSVAEFLALVDCDPSEVRDTNAALAASAQSRAVRSRSLRPVAGLHDHSPMPFGMHKGKPLGQVPSHYLQWLATSPDTGNATPSGLQFKRQLQAYLRLA